MTGLELRQITKSYSKGQNVLEPLDLIVNPGELFFLLGPSGCGKSTLLRIVAGIIPPDSGRVFFDGRDVTALPPEKRDTPMVFQNYALWPHLDVFENVAFGLRVRRIKKNEIEKKVASLLETVRLSELKHRKIASLSGGQQQRVALARALATDPGLILFDEPLSNLDAKLRDTMRLEIRRICREHRLTALYVTHDRKEALSIGDRIAVMENGRIRQIGTPREIYERPADSFVASFLGDANFLTGRFLGRENGFFLFSTSFGTFRVLAEGTPRPEENTVYTLMFRPGSICMNAPENAINCFSARMIEQTFLGEGTFYRLDCAGTIVEANEYNAPGREPVAALFCSVPPERIAILKNGTGDAVK